MQFRCEPSLRNAIPGSRREGRDSRARVESMPALTRLKYPVWRCDEKTAESGGSSRTPIRKSFQAGEEGHFPPDEQGAPYPIRTEHVRQGEQSSSRAHRNGANEGLSAPQGVTVQPANLPISMSRGTIPFIPLTLRSIQDAIGWDGCICKPAFSHILGIGYSPVHCTGFGRAAVSIPDTRPVP